MSEASEYRRAPRGRPSIGFLLEVPREVELREGDTVVCREVRPDGRMVGELEVSVFAAALVIDRDGILAEKAREAMVSMAMHSNGAHAVPVALPAGGGFRSDAVAKAPLPYIYVFTIAPSDLGVDGGVLVTIRSAGPDWAAADHILRSLRILTRNGRIATNDETDDAPILPVVAPTRD
jgi:hypothetical protein